MKSAALAAAALVASHAHAAVERFASNDYGVLARYDSEPSPAVSSVSSGNPPYNGWLGLQAGWHWQLGNYFSDGVAEYRLDSLGNHSHYY